MSGTQTLSRAAALRDISSEKPVDSSPSDGDEDSRDAELAYDAHPLGVKPGGNALAAQATASGKMGVFGGLPDEIILEVLQWLDGKSLLNIGASCRGLYAYTTFDQLWKDLFILYAEFLAFLFPPLSALMSCLSSSLLHQYRLSPSI